VHISITNTADGEQRIKDIYGDSVVIIPYIMPGFDLSLLCAKLFPEGKTDNTIGMVLLNHGIFSFGDTAKQSYDRMIELVAKAENYLQQHNAWNVPSINETKTAISNELPVCTKLPCRCIFCVPATRTPVPNIKPDGNVES